MKHSVNAKKAHSDLQKALDRMLKVLKNLNDSLHVVGLKGFPVSLRGGGGGGGGTRGSKEGSQENLNNMLHLEGLKRFLIGLRVGGGGGGGGGGYRFLGRVCGEL